MARYYDNDNGIILNAYEENKAREYLPKGNYSWHLVNVYRDRSYSQKIYTFHCSWTGRQHQVLIPDEHMYLYAQQAMNVYQAQQQVQMNVYPHMFDNMEYTVRTELQYNDGLEKTRNKEKELARKKADEKKKSNIRKLYWRRKDRKSITK